MAEQTRHRVLIVGVGSIGERHLRCFQQTRRCELTFVEINDELRQTISQRYGVPGFSSLDEALTGRHTRTPSPLAGEGGERREPGEGAEKHSFRTSPPQLNPLSGSLPADQAAEGERGKGTRLAEEFTPSCTGSPKVAVICTPAHLHVPIARQLAEASIHLLIEKPLSTSLDGIDPLRETINRRGVVCGIAYVYRAHPALTAMRQAVRSGRFGRPLELVAVGGQHFPTYRPAYREIYYKNRATGGGAIQDALTHILNAGEWLLGPVTRLVADADHQRLDGVAVEDTVHLLARHGDVLASYSLNQHQAPNENTITVVCELGTLRFEGHEHRWRWIANPGDAWHEEPHAPLERDSLFVAQANQFLDAVEGTQPVACTLDDGLQTLRVNLAALASADGGGWQTIP